MDPGLVNTNFSPGVQTALWFCKEFFMDSPGMKPLKIKELYPERDVRAHYSEETVYKFYNNQIYECSSNLHVMNMIQEPY